MINWLEQLRVSKKLIIVEGEKDKLALHKLGVDNVLALSRKPLYKFVEEVSLTQKEVIILTDFDSEGRKIYHRFKHNLQKHGVKVDNKFREALFKETHISQIEGIFKYFSKHASRAA